MLQNIGAFLAGLVVGSALNMALVQLNLQFFPLPPGTDLSDAEAFRALVAGMPPQAWILVFAGHLGQSYVGARVAARLAASAPMGLAMGIGGVSLLGGIANAAMLDLECHSTGFAVKFQ